MADSAVDITAGTGTSIDTRTEGTNGHHRQVVVLGDPATNAGVAPVDATSGVKVNLGVDNDVTTTRTGATTAALANVAGSASSVTLQASNTARLKVIIVNDSTAILYVKYGSTASATSFTYKLEAGETLDEGLYTGIVTGIWVSATGSARMTELTA